MLFVPIFKKFFYVSHQPERKEKDCLNCGTEVLGRFCHSCGQENIVTRQSFWSLVTHFVADILHFDGKFFHTLALLFTRPGFVAKQYTIGKRMTYLDPIRMYLFTSAVFFLVFFSINDFKFKEKGKEAVLSNKERIELAESYEEDQDANKPDSALLRKIFLLRDTTKPVVADSVFEQKRFFSVTGRRYSSAHEYDSVQRTLPKDSGMDGLRSC